VLDHLWSHRVGACVLYMAVSLAEVNNHFIDHRV